MVYRKRKHHVTRVRSTAPPFAKHKGPRTAIGPTSWRTLLLPGKKGGPMVGSGKGAAFVSRNGVGPQTVKRPGPVLY